ncbi:hypothetical protein [Coleofasciculus chthonoplastes]|uniref:Uncharacterized protein n=1 Tax=Coleofasciculus chthonoplastes PCC 7420 TaxID=118168 RepID=B4VX72_9CYAN|nr:hypothetical protein [Coleofasciculus chthonoplastes]EDX73512.1 hypothetical protein MC7420_3686 [Coleofasciculus chthonoplastes PCC 7420]
MTFLQLAVITCLTFVLIKFTASVFGYGNNRFLNSLVTAILAIFVTFELVKLLQAVFIKLG